MRPSFLSGHIGDSREETAWRYVLFVAYLLQVNISVHQISLDFLLPSEGNAIHEQDSHLPSQRVPVLTNEFKMCLEVLGLGRDRVQPALWVYFLCLHVLFTSSVIIGGGGWVIYKCIFM